MQDIFGCIVFPILIAIVFAIIGFFFSGCSTLKIDCYKAPEHIACAETYEGDIPCYYRHSDKGSFSYTRDEWEDEKIGRISVTASDYVKIKERLLQLEAITCTGG